MLAQQQPATFVIFDILEAEKGINLMSLPLSERRRLVEMFWNKYFRSEKAIKLSPQTASITEAMGWLHSPGWHIDGIVAKNSTDVYVLQIAWWVGFVMAQIHTKWVSCFSDFMTKKGVSTMLALHRALPNVISLR